MHGMYEPGAAFGDRHPLEVGVLLKIVIYQYVMFLGLHQRAEIALVRPNPVFGKQ
jgi:hypothetical protein